MYIYFFINNINNNPPPYNINIIEELPLNNEDNEEDNEVPIFVNAVGILLNPLA